MHREAEGELPDGGFLSEHENAQLAANWHRLSALYGRSVPTFLPGPVSLGRWEPYAYSCLARGHYALQTVVAVADREIDASVMLRVAFEFLCTFAWLMIAPEQHYPMLLRTDLIERTKLANDLDDHAIGDVPFEEADATFAEIEKFASENPAPVLPVRAEKADNH